MNVVPIETIDGVTVTPLRRIENPKGDLYHAMKASEPSFSTFGEAYFTTVIEGEHKGWKRHRVMRLNLVVPAGAVTFCVIDEVGQQTGSVRIDAENYARLTVDPGLWMGFRGDGPDTNLILNLASIEHDPDEADAVDIDQFPFS